MKIVLPVAGEDIGEHFRNIYHRIIKNNEPIITSLNGITAVLFPDDNEFEFDRYLNVEFRHSVNIDAVKAYYLRDLEAKDPSGYTEVKKYRDQYNKESGEARNKVKMVKGIINSLEMIEHGGMTTPTISSIILQLQNAVADR
jgi:hypothetical protein